MGDSLPTDEMASECPEIILFPIRIVRRGAEVFPNFYIGEDELKDSLPHNVNLNVLKKGIQCNFSEGIDRRP